MFCLRRQNSFSISQNILVKFNNSVIASVWHICMICWGANVKSCDKRRLDVGELLHDVDSIYDKEISTKLKIVMDDVSHPLQLTLIDQLILRSGLMRIPNAHTLIMFF